MMMILKRTESEILLTPTFRSGQNTQIGNGFGAIFSLVFPEYLKNRDKTQSILK